MMNDETEQFEQRLSRQPLRQIPQTWRAEILAAARTTPPARHLSPAARHSWLSTILDQVSNLLWPHPIAWTGLAAVWALILGVNFSMRDRTPVAAQKFAPPSPEVIVELKKQQRLFAELVGPIQTHDSDRQKSFAPRPRSERDKILMT